MKTPLIACILLTSSIHPVFANTDAINSLMKQYLAEGGLSGNASNGELIWNKKYPGKAPYEERSCTRCHTKTLTIAGKHMRTGKSIPPMAPSVNSNSLTKLKHIKKWLKRNCKWTLGRECSVQEKTDLITYISQQ